MTQEQEQVTKSTAETVRQWLDADDPAEAVLTHVRALERALADLIARNNRLEHKVKTLTTELATTRHLASIAERQRDGVDEDSFDPTKQKGIGAIPIGGDFRELEALEHMLGMAPTLDEQLRQLGMATPEEQLRALGMGKESAEIVAVVLAAATQDDINVPRMAFMRLVQLVWAARARLMIDWAAARLVTGSEDDHVGEIGAIVTAIEALPTAWFDTCLHLAGWNAMLEPLPPLREQ